MAFNIRLTWTDTVGNLDIDWLMKVSYEKTSINYRLCENDMADLTAVRMSALSFISLHIATKYNKGLLKLFYYALFTNL